MLERWNCPAHVATHDVDSPEERAKIVNTWERLIPEYLADDALSKRLYQLHLARYQTACEYVDNKRVLDIACGVGYGSRLLRESGAARVVGVDRSEDAIHYAKRHYAAEGVEYTCADAETFEWPQPFDVIVSFETIEHLKDPEAFVSRVRRLLVDDGLFVMSVPLGETRHLDPYHLHAFEEDQLLQMVKNAGYELEKHRRDELFLRWNELLRWRNLYPDAPTTTVRELVFTLRGIHVLTDCIVRGGIEMPSMVVVARAQTVEARNART